MSKNLKSFVNISSKMNKIFNESEGLRPYEIVGKIVNDFNLKTLYTGDEGKDKIERIRGIYVAITRAKKHLYITCNTHAGYNRKTTKSSFISLIPQKYIDSK